MNKLVKERINAIIENPSSKKFDIKLPRLPYKKINNSENDKKIKKNILNYKKELEIIVDNIINNPSIPQQKKNKINNSYYFNNMCFNSYSTFTFCRYVYFIAYSDYYGYFFK